VRDGIVVALADPQANATGNDVAAVLDDVIVQGDVVRLLGGIASIYLFADGHPAGAQIAEQATLHPAMAAAPPEPQAVGAHMRDFAVLEQDIPGAVEHHGGIEAPGALARTLAPGRREPLAVVKGQSLELEMLYEAAGRGVALDLQEPADHGRHELQGGGIFSRMRFVIELSIPGQEPFAGLVQRGEEVLQVEVASGIPG
jgi:hypothetical protein